MRIARPDIVPLLLAAAFAFTQAVATQTLETGPSTSGTWLPAENATGSPEDPTTAPISRLLKLLELA